MARADGCADLRQARELLQEAERAAEQLPEGAHARPVALALAGLGHAVLAQLAVDVLAESGRAACGSELHRAWESWRDETGIRLR
ncbi:hypothetical protein ACIBH1_45695 [Nonomuraea sp. NPDC050663]|uniref:hypothetical protein n=1 Tax=Nonomuraea sp. NPDC050663 TaxID=3364370 RepID=UPI0037BCE37E